MNFLTEIREGFGISWAAIRANIHAFLDANAARTFFQTEYRLRTADGTYRWAIDMGRPWFSKTGEYAGMVGAVFDIDARKRAEEALEEASVRKDQFLATLAHELRNPLAPISNALQIWPLVEHKPGEGQRLRDMMGRQVQQMVRLIDDLLDVSRITRGKIELRREKLDLADAIGAAAEALQPFIDLHRHQLTLDLPAQPVFVDADPGRLVQVFGNLLNNAAKYTRTGGRIVLTVRREGDTAVVAVRDTGSGIPREMLASVFEMFIQVDQTLGRSHGGLGIGLTLVKNLVALHGGTVEAISEGLGHGSEFIVRLPAADPDATSDAGPVMPAQALPPRRRVLVVDDVEPSANTLALMLEGLGQQPHAVYGAASALKALTEFSPEVAFVDIAMPGMDGYELVRRIRGLPGQRPVLVALTGFGQEEDRQRALQAGFDHHMVKPATLDAIHALLTQLAPR